MERELISIREAARRLGVSDTALHKALKAGRIEVANQGEKRPKLAWPQVQTDYESTGQSEQMKRRQEPEDDEEDDPFSEALPPGVTQAEVKKAKKTADLYYEARAKKTAYQARLAQLDYEEKKGKLIDAATVAAEWAKVITAAKTKILGIPAMCKTRVGDLPMPALAAIEQVCREVLESLSNDAGNSD